MAEMPVRVIKLMASDMAERKLGARGISVGEARQIIHNHYETKRNPRSHDGTKRRIYLIGFTDGGRALTLVIEETFDPGDWKIVTGWVATRREREILG
jgi:uncharacterized DUF497 family protein